MQDSKILNTTGDGGMVTTDDDEAAAFCREFRNHGFLSTKKLDDLHIYIHPRMGYNYRMTEIQAAVGLKAMDRLDGYIETRRANAAFLSAEIEKIDGLIPMAEPPGAKCTYYVYYSTIDLDKFRVDRDRFVRALSAEGISVRIGTSAELYAQEFFQKKSGHSWDPRVYDGDVDYTTLVCPVARQVGRETFALAVAPPATEDDMADVVAALRKVADAYRA
jgi:dTDP-4-amino-4,6-dideoxygalactose transaminase